MTYAAGRCIIVIRKYWRKLLAPVIITVLLLIILICYLITLLFIGMVDYAFNGANWLIVVIGLSICGGCGVSVYVLWERIREISSGEEDDLDKY